MHKNTQKDNKTFDEFVSRQHETDPETALIDWEKERSVARSSGSPLLNGGILSGQVCPFWADTV
jgi:hypothetical protein